MLDKNDNFERSFAKDLFQFIFAQFLALVFQVSYGCSFDYCSAQS